MRSKRTIITLLTGIVSLLVICAAVTLCIVFPNKYSSEVSSAAKEFGLPSSLVKSVVWAESKFDRHAVSEKGASGLMQLMPETLKECANALGIAEPDRFDAKTSLRCGCYYLSLMLDKFDGNEKAALMAYNAGEANARRFMLGETVFPETQKYIQDIMFAKKVYGIVS